MRYHAVYAILALGCGGGGGDGTPAADAPESIDAAPPPIDAPVVPAVCGDGTCSVGETATACCADCGVCGDQQLVTIETGVPGGAPGTGVTPGGMAASYSSFDGGPFTTMEFPIEVVAEPPLEAGYFWAQTFYFGTTDQTGYTGLQTGSECGGGPAGKRAIFSIWDASRAVPGPGAYCGRFGGEGVGYQCCAPFAWREGVAYRFVVREVAADQWQMTLHDPATRTERVLGTITAAASYGRLIGQTTGFVEYYLSVLACATTPHAQARLYRPSADGAPATSVQTITYGTCAAQATATCTGTACP
jgi:hypothetical protein